MVPGRKQRGSAGVGLEPWPEPAEQAGLGCTSSSLPSALSPTAGTPTQSCLPSPWPSVARRVVQCRGAQHLAPVHRVLSPSVRDGGAPFHPAARLPPCSPHSFASAGAPGSGAAIGTLAARHQSGLQEGCKESVEAGSPPKDRFRAPLSTTGGSFGEKSLSPSI